MSFGFYGVVFGERPVWVSYCGRPFFFCCKTIRDHWIYMKNI